MNNKKSKIFKEPFSTRENISIKKAITFKRNKNILEEKNKVKLIKERKII